MSETKEPWIDNPSWRPVEVHPLAALFPMMPPADFDALVEDIKENGQQYPITIDHDGTLIDGRMRLAACEKGEVDPWFESLNGQDPVAFIWSANAKRRQMSKGQMAMIAAMGLTLEAKARPMGGIEEGKAAVAKAAGVSPARISQALLVREHAPNLVQDVIDGKPDMGLDRAYERAQANQKEKEWRDNGVELLRAEDRDLAQKVDDREMTLDAARKVLDARKRDREAVRDSVLLGMSSVKSLIGFDKSEALPVVIPQLGTEEGEEHLKRYFPDGVKQLNQTIAAAKLGLAALEKAAKQIGKGKPDGEAP